MFFYLAEVPLHTAVQTHLDFMCAYLDELLQR